MADEQKQNSTLYTLNKDKWVGLILATLGAIAFSGKAIVVKLAYQYGVDAITLLMYRMLFALPLFIILLLWAVKQTNPVQDQLKTKDFLGVIALGFFGYYMASYLDFMGLQYISASLERLILYLNPTIVMLIAWGLWGKKIKLAQTLGMFISYSGVVWALSTELHFEGKNVLLGTVLVFLSAVSYAIYLAFSGQWVERFGSLRLVCLSSIVACFFCIGQFFMTHSISDMVVPQPVIVLSIINAVFCTVIPVIFVMLGIRRLGASLASQVGLLGPVSTFILAYFFLTEPITFNAIMGGLLVLVGVALASSNLTGQSFQNIMKNFRSQS